MGAGGGYCDETVRLGRDFLRVYVARLLREARGCALKESLGSAVTSRGLSETCGVNKNTHGDSNSNIKKTARELE